MFSTEQKFCINGDNNEALAKVIAPLKDNEYKTNRNGIFLWKAL